MNLITHDVNGIAIGQRSVDGYINLTAMAQANSKLIADYLRLESTKAFLEELSETMGIPIVALIQIKAGRKGGTWGHPQAAIHCGQWCSAKFAVLVSKWIYDWLREGTTPKTNVGIPSQELELKKLDLQLIQAKQRYLETSHAIQLSTSPATLAWLRGETPPPPKVEYRERFIDAATRKEIGNGEGRSLTQLIADAGLNPKSTKHRQKVKRILKSCGFDYDRQQGWVMASYLNKYPVLADQTYEQALRAVLAEVATEGTETNLFVHHMQQTALAGQSSAQALQSEKAEN